MPCGPKSARHIVKARHSHKLPIHGLVCICICMQTHCALQVGGNQLAFEACNSFSAHIGTDYNLLWSLTADPKGNHSCLLTGALDVLHDGWAGFGLPGEQGGMLGGSAVIVKACATCTTGEWAVVAFPAVTIFCAQQGLSPPGSS